MVREKDLLRERFIDFRTGDSGTLAAIHQASEKGYLYAEFYPELTIWSLYKIFLPFLMKTKVTHPFTEEFFYKHQYPSDMGLENNPVWAMVIDPECDFMQDVTGHLNRKIDNLKQELNMAYAGKATATQKLKDETAGKEKEEAKKPRPSVPQDDQHLFERIRGA